MQPRRRDVDPGFRQPSHYCDSQSEIINAAAANITRTCQSEREIFQHLFYWVRDTIVYQLGLCGDTASETLRKGAGSCTNKANLLVALLRNLGIPAGYHLMEVKAKEYMGELCSERFNRLMGEKSLHTYCSAFIEGRWIKVDPSDDIRLSNAVKHLAVQCTVVEFDGYTDARLHLLPEHVLSDSAEPVPSVDHVLSKTRRLPADMVEVLNLYLEFMRGHGIWHFQIRTFEDAFFAWMQKERPQLFASYTALNAAVPPRAVGRTG